MTKGIALTLANKDIRIERIDWLAACHCGFDDWDDLAMNIKDALNSEYACVRHESMAPFKGVHPDAFDNADDFMSWTADLNLYGFIVAVATPLPTMMHGDYAAYSWGYYRTVLMYVDRIEDVVPMAVVWRDQTWEMQKDKLDNSDD